jgi:hypothetical protein
LAGEVSSVNDDNIDNRFLEPVSRFPDIEEGAEPYSLLCSEYPPGNARDQETLLQPIAQHTVSVDSG